MARKITVKAVSAMLSGRNFKENNTHVFYDEAGNQMVMNLHGNTIALLSDNGKRLEVNDCGWKTMVTYERLGELIRQFTGGIYTASMRKGGTLINLSTRKEKPLYSLGDDWATFLA